MLGSLSEAEDAVQETWVRLDRTDTSDVANLDGWLTTVIGRICLNMLRAQQARPEQPAGLHVPDPVVTRPDGTGPEDQALTAESVGMAMLVVLETLTPSERLAFVLHDMFSVPFREIAEILGQSSQAARQLASRARRKVTLAAAEPDPDLGRQRRAVDAFFAASRDGDFAALLAVLDPDVVLRSDGGPSRPAAAGLVRGADRVAAQAIGYGRFADAIRPAVVNGAAGAVVAPRGRPVSVMAFTVRDGRILGIDVLADPQRLRALGLTSWPG
jgi:RNA polymerase sigma-70 factor (ECF subfamily)